nr:glycosyltransferase [Helicobacter saguini]
MKLASENIKVAVIVPIFNVEQYLRECLDSIINQSYKNIEAILVNDGSTDSNSLNIAKEYVAKNANFTLIDKPNLGLSSSRNVALDFLSQSYKLELDSKETQRVKENIESKMQDSKEIQNLDSKNVNIPTAVLPTTILPTPILPTPQPPSAREGGYPYQDFKENIESNGEDSTLTPTHHPISLESNLLIYKVINENPYDIKAIYVNKDSIKNNTQLPTPLTPLRKGGGNSTQDSKDIESKTLQIPKIDYIIFLDSDDYWKSDCIESCIKAALQSEVEIQNIESNAQNFTLTPTHHPISLESNQNNHPKRAEIIWFDWEYFYDGIDKPKNKWKSWQEIYGFKGDSLITKRQWLTLSVEKNPEFFAFGWMAMIDFKYLQHLRLRFIDRIMNEDVLFETLLFFKSRYIYVLNKKLYMYRIRPNSITDYSAKANIPPYLEPLLVHFSGNERNTKEYHKARSWLVMMEDLESSLKDYALGDSKVLQDSMILQDSNMLDFNAEDFKAERQKDISLLREAFYPKFCEMILHLASFPEDPLGLLPRMSVIKPYINDAKAKGVKVKRFKKLALNNLAMYRIFSPLIVLYRNVKDIERKFRKRKKG